MAEYPEPPRQEESISIAGSWPFPDWHAEARDRLAAQLAERQRIRNLRAADRAAQAEARTPGLARRHSNKLRRNRAGDTTSKESK